MTITFDSPDNAILRARDDAGQDYLWPAETIASYGDDVAPNVADTLGVDASTLTGLDAALVAISATVDGLVTTQRASDAGRARSILSTGSDA